jgi:hypothetical protein
LVAAKVKVPVGRREKRVRLTLFRNRSAFECTSVRVRAYQCVCVCQSSTHTTTAITNRTHIFSNTHLNTDAKSNQTHIIYISWSIILNVIHVKERKTWYAYLPQSAEAAEDWVRQGYQLIARDPQRPVGRREERVRLTLVAIAAPLRVSQCVCACVSVCACLPILNACLMCTWGTRTCTHNTSAKHASDMYIYSHTNIKHTLQCDPHTWCTNKSNALYSKPHTSIILSKCHSC